MTREEFLKQLPELAEGYQTPPDAKARIANVDLLMLVGATGVGKTSIIKRLGIPFVITDTTRSIRPDEINGSDYYFRTDYEQLASEIKERQFVQINIFSTGDFYGTRASSYPELGFAVYAIVADKISEFRQMGFADTMTAFIVPPSYEEWMHRIEYLNTEKERDQLSKRLEEARNSFSLALFDKQTRFILNDDIDKAVEQTRGLLVGKIDKDREFTAQSAAQEILNAIKIN